MKLEYQLQFKIPILSLIKRHSMMMLPLCYASLCNSLMKGTQRYIQIIIQGKVKKHLKNGKRFPERDIWRVAYQGLMGLAKLHDCSIIHRDIKSANIFFHNGNLKIGDLNVAKHLKDKFTATQTGTPYYASPEVWKEQPYDFKSDIWSLGCIIY